jgi:hypothetical protein
MFNSGIDFGIVGFKRIVEKAEIMRPPPNKNKVEGIQCKWVKLLGQNTKNSSVL